MIFTFSLAIVSYLLGVSGAVDGGLWSVDGLGPVGLTAPLTA